MKRGNLKRKTPLAKTGFRRKAVRKRRTKTDLQKAKERLWELCREISKRRHGTNCYTCPAKDLTGSNCQLGHFISSSICSTELRYDLSNLRIQCSACNIWKSGNWIQFEKHLIADGIDVEYLKRRNEETKDLRIVWTGT